MPLSPSRRLALSACALAVLAPFASVVPPQAWAAGARALDGSRSPRALLAHGDALVVVALFSVPGCPWCEVVRRNYLRHLEGAVPGVRVAEYGITDERPFERTGPSDDTPQSASALAKSLGIRVSPTVAFLDDDNGELAERLVGYNSPDFYGAYLDARIAGALERAAQKRHE
ncbi:MAG: thioredoxin fold domain-containing protein [Burkholderiaceae bacterium]|nr:thioredoxin fold domain-containing protein [Burkholderiaceae bacterium]